MLEFAKNKWRVLTGRDARRRLGRAHVAGRISGGSSCNIGSMLLHSPVGMREICLNAASAREESGDARCFGARC
jgi:hypothetical protein